MTATTIHIGEVQVSALLDTEADQEGSIADAFPDAPREELLAEKSRYPGVYGANDAWRLFVRAWLIQHSGGLLLVDTGVGETSVQASWLPVPGSLPSALADIGVEPGDIDTVVLTHVHDDHAGGTVTAGGEPRFPNAHYLLQRADRDAIREWAQASEFDRAIEDILIRPLEAAGLMDLVDGDVTLSDAIGLRHVPGHTPGHQVVTVESGGGRLLLSGDTWNHPAQFAHPDWPSGPDADHAASAQGRRAMLEHLRTHPGTIVAPTHFAEPFGRLVDDPDGLATWSPTG